MDIKKQEASEMFEVDSHGKQTGKTSRKLKMSIYVTFWGFGDFRLRLRSFLDSGMGVASQLHWLVGWLVGSLKAFTTIGKWVKPMKYK